MDVVYTQNPYALWEKPDSSRSHAFVTGENDMTAYLPLTRHRGSRLSRSSATPSASPAHTSAFSVLRAIGQYRAAADRPENGSPKTEDTDCPIERSQRGRERGGVRPADVARQFPVIEIAFENDQRRLLELLQQLL